MKYWFLGLPFLLCATVNEPLNITLFSGYRNDRIHWHANEGSIFSEQYRDVEFWQNGLRLKCIYRDLSFDILGSYSAFGKGEVFQKKANGETQKIETRGWAADAIGHFGYAVNLTPDRVYQVVLTPLLGYSGYFERQFSNHTFKMDWYGFMLGALFSIKPGNRSAFDVGYTYHFLHSKVRIPEKFAGGNKGHTGWFEMDYFVDCDWRLGLGSSVHYFFTRVLEEEKFKLRWTGISGWVQISRNL